MLGAPLDTLYMWTTLSVAATILVGMVVGLPVTSAPDASGVAGVADTVATVDYDTTTEHDLDADAVRIGLHRIGLRNNGGAVHATFGFGPVMPVTLNFQLGSAAYGAPPSVVFGMAAELDTMAETTRDRNTSWRPASELLIVRHVSWEGTDIAVVPT